MSWPDAQIPQAPRAPGHRVVVLGWHDATLRHLRTVARMHELRGDRVEVVQSQSGRALSTPHGLRDEGRRLAARLARAHEVEPLPLVFHSFSNAGFWTLSATLDALACAHPFTLDAHVATILDSAPGFPESVSASFTMRTAPMAFLPGLLARLGLPPAHHHPIFEPPLRAFFGLWHVLSPIQVRFMERAPQRVRAAHAATPSRAARPLLAIWGGADVLVEPRFVDAFLARCEAEAIPVTRLFFPASAHVRHFVAHRAAYETAVRDFLAARVATGS
ncbi:MAG: hypothetical protein OHK0013_10730 [Sandaracinaceae bacterium]